MTYVEFCEEDQAVFKRIARALEGIESKMTPVEVVESGPETVETTQKLLSDIADDIEEELKVSRERACSWFRTDVIGGPENLYMTAVGDFMKIFCKALDKAEDKMKKEGKE